MKRKIIAGLLLGLWGCAPAAEPAEAPRVITPLMLEAPPIYALLGYRQDLALQSRQISALDSIAQHIQQQNAPLIDSLRIVGRERGGRYSGMLQVDEQTEPLLERLRANHREAVRQVQEVLTEEQRATTCRLFNQARDRRIEQQRSGRAPAPPRGMPADSSGWQMGGRVWPWCGETPASPG